MNKLDPRFLKGLGNFVEGVVTSNSMPSSPATGAKYLCLYESDTAHFNKIAQYNGSRWEYFTLEAGSIVTSKTFKYKFNGTSWVKERQTAFDMPVIDLFVKSTITETPSNPQNYSIGDYIININTGTFYQVIDQNGSPVFDNGTAIALNDGETFLVKATNDGSIYEFFKGVTNSITWRYLVTNLAVGTVFFVNEPAGIYKQTTSNTAENISNIASSSSGITVQTFTLTSSNVSNKSVTLSSSVSSPSKIDT